MVIISVSKVFKIVVVPNVTESTSLTGPKMNHRSTVPTSTIPHSKKMTIQFRPTLNRPTEEQQLLNLKQ